MFRTILRTRDANRRRSKPACGRALRSVGRLTLGWLALTSGCTELANPDERGDITEPGSVTPTSRDDHTADTESDDLSSASGELGGPSTASDAEGDPASPALPSTPGSDAAAPDGGLDASSEAGPRDPGLPGSSSACPDGFRFGRSCYRPSRVALSWDDARTDCLAGGADLVHIEGLEEEAFVAARLDVSIWLGGSDRATANVFAWTDGSLVSFSNWGPSQPDAFPDQNCIEKRQEQGEPWYDQFCSNLLFYVCERALAE
jgi:hypothetical protein